MEQFSVVECVYNDSEIHSTYALKYKSIDMYGHGANWDRQQTGLCA